MRSVHSARFHADSTVTALTAAPNSNLFYSGDDRGRVCWWSLREGEPPKLVGQMLLDSAIQSILLLPVDADNQQQNFIVLTRDGRLHWPLENRSVRLMPQLSFVQARICGCMLLVPYDDLVFGYALQMDGDGGRFAFILRAEQSAAGQQRKYGTVMSVLVLSENRIIVAYESGNLCEFTFPLSLLSLKGAFGNREGLSLFEWQFGCEEETNFPPTLSPIKSMDAMPKTPITDMQEICLGKTRVIVCVGAGPEISVINVEKECVEAKISTNVHANCLSIRQNGAMFSVGGWDGCVRIYRIAATETAIALKKLGKIYHSRTGIRNCIFHDNYRLIVNAQDGVLAIYEP